MLVPRLAGSFASLPTRRDVSSGIVARVRLSEEIAVGAAAFQGHTVQATNGEGKPVRLDYSEQRFRQISGKRLLRGIPEATE